MHLEMGIVFVSVFDGAHVSLLRFNKTRTCSSKLRLRDQASNAWLTVLVYHKSIYTSNML